MSETASTEHEVKHLPALDTPAINAAAAAWVAKQLEGCADTSARAQKAAKIVIRETEQADEVRARRDAAAYTLVTNYRVRRGADIPSAIGCNRNRWKVIRDRFAARDDFEPVPDALEVLPKLAAETARHAGRAEAARIARDDAVAALLAEGKSSAEVARLIGRDPSRVSHIKHREGSAA